MKLFLKIFFIIIVIPYFLISCFVCFTLDDDWSKTTINSSQVETQKDNLILDLISRDKKDKVMLMMRQGVSEADANKTVEALSSQYEIERKKFYSYCKEDSENYKSIISIKEGTDSCGHIWRLIFDKPYSEKGAIEIIYFFDKDSLEFFNQYIVRDYMEKGGYVLSILNIAPSLLDGERNEKHSSFILKKRKKFFKQNDSIKVKLN